MRTGHLFNFLRPTEESSVIRIIIYILVIMIPYFFSASVSLLYRQVPDLFNRISKYK